MISPTCQHKRLSLLLTLLSCAAILWAQPKLLHEEMYIGVQGGAMASMMQFSPTVRMNIKNPHLGGTAGVVFRYMGHKVCGLQVEANWMSKGWNEVGSGQELVCSRTLDYIEVPFLCHLAFGKRCRGFFNLGPQIGYLVRDEIRPADGTTDMSTYAPQYGAIDNKFDWGVAGGLGIYARSRKAGTYQLEARFNYSLGTLFSNSQMDYFRNSNAMNLSLCFAYLWQFKGDK